MEGASGIILPTNDPRVVIKRIYKKSGAHRRTKSYRAPDQYRLQLWAHLTAVPSHRFMRLFVPQPFDSEENQYKMERIEVSRPIEITDIDTVPELRQDLQRFYAVGRESGIYPQDYELYKQPDGRIAMVDFDKFGVWNKDGSVTFPWGLHWAADEVASFTPLNLNT